MLMLVSLSVVAAIVLPILYFILLDTPPFEMGTKAAANPEVFENTIKKCIDAGDIVRAVKLCAAVRPALLARFTTQLLEAAEKKDHARVQQIIENCERETDDAIEMMEAFSIARLIRDVIAFGIPIACAFFVAKESAAALGLLIVSLVAIWAQRVIVGKRREQRVHWVEAAPATVSKIRDAFYARFPKKAVS